MIDLMYDLPELEGYEITITKECIAHKEKPFLLKKRKIYKKEPNLRQNKGLAKD